MTLSALRSALRNHSAAIDDAKEEGPRGTWKNGMGNCVRHFGRLCLGQCLQNTCVCGLEMNKDSVASLRPSTRERKGAAGRARRNRNKGGIPWLAQAPVLSTSAACQSQVDQSQGVPQTNEALLESPDFCPLNNGAQSGTPHRPSRDGVRDLALLGVQAAVCKEPGSRRNPRFLPEWLRYRFTRGRIGELDRERLTAWLLTGAALSRAGSQPKGHRLLSSGQVEP